MTEAQDNTPPQRDDVTTGADFSGGGHWVSGFTGERLRDDVASSTLWRRFWRGAKKMHMWWMLIGFLFFLVLSAARLMGADLRAVHAFVDERVEDRLPVDGRSNLTGGDASISYLAAPGLIELNTDEHWDEGPNDGARWELRSNASKGYNVVSLSHYVFSPTLNNTRAIDRFVAAKDVEHRKLSDRVVGHREIEIDGRTGYVWDHPGNDGYWYFAAWFPHPVHTIRLECIAKRQVEHFERLCATALKTLQFKETSPSLPPHE